MNKYTENKMNMQRQPLRKLTKAYLVKFFRNKELAYEEWIVITDGVRRVVNNYSVIEMILRANYEEQRELADALCELDSANRDINMFLKHLAIECNISGRLESSQTEALLKAS